LNTENTEGTKNIENTENAPTGSGQAPQADGENKSHDRDRGQRKEGGGGKPPGQMRTQRKMPGFPTKTVGTPTRREKARRYMKLSAAFQARWISVLMRKERFSFEKLAPIVRGSGSLLCSAGLCPGLWGLPAFFAGRARHEFLPGRLPNA
jgi:hypothetical protein